MNSKRISLYEQIEKYLYRLLANNLDNKDFKLPSEISLAIQFNVSRTTTRKAMENLHKRGFVVRKKGFGTIINPEIDEACNTILLQYKDTSAPVSVTKRINTVAAIVPDLKSKYMTELIDGIQSMATKNNWNVIIATSDYDQELEAQLIRNFLTSCSGLIIFPVNKTTYNQEIIKLSLKKYPLVVIDNLLNGVDTSFVTSQNRKTSYKIVKHFIKKGKKKIGIISNAFNSAYSLLERYRGYRDALNELNIPVNRDYILNDLGHYDKNAESKIEAFLKGHPRLDLVIAFNYEIGLKTLKALKNGINNLTTEDLVIFDEEFEPLYDLMKYKVNYVKQNPSVVGQTAFRIISEKHADPDTLNKHIIVSQTIELIK